MEPKVSCFFAYSARDARLQWQHGLWYGIMNIPRSNSEALGGCGG